MAKDGHQHCGIYRRRRFNLTSVWLMGFDQIGSSSKIMILQRVLYVAILSLTVAITATGCATPTVSPNPQTGLPQTNYVANSTAIGVTQSANAIAPLIPAPFGTILGALATLVAAGASGIAAYKNKKMNEHASMLAATIAGVETAGTDDTKKAIQNLAAAAGVQDKLNAIVQKVTGNMT